MDVVDDAAVRAIAGQFQVAGTVVAAQPHGSGHINTSYRVRCRLPAGAGSSYLLQRINTAIFTDPAALMGNIGRVTAHLRTTMAGEPEVERRVLRLVPARDGDTWHRHADGSCWRMYHFVDGAETLDHVLSPSQARAAARAFGNFQQQLATLPAPRLHETIPRFHDTPYRLETFQRAVEEDRVRCAATCQPEIAALLRQGSLAAALQGSGMPERVTHNDTKLNNVLFDAASGAPLCVVDLDTVMPGLLLHDFGDMVRTATCAAAEDEEDLRHVHMQLPLYRALLQGYAESIAAFATAEERAHLYLAGPVITYEQALRFLTDHLQGDTYYRVARPDHNLHRARTQLALLHSMEQQLEQMAALTGSAFDAARRGGGPAV